VESMIADQKLNEVHRQPLLKRMGNKLEED
jgi:hypothetical protein